MISDIIFLSILLFQHETQTQVKYIIQGQKLL